MVACEHVSYFFVNCFLNICYLPTSLFLNDVLICPKFVMELDGCSNHLGSSEAK